MKRILSLLFVISLLLLAVFSLCSFTYNVNYTIYYVNDYGTEIADRVEGVLNAASPDLAIPSPEIEGYGLIDEDDSIVTVDKLAVDYPPSHYERNIITTKPDNFMNVQKALADKLGEPENAELTWIPNMPMDLDDEAYAKVEKLVDALDANDDVQKVFTAAA